MKTTVKKEVYHPVEKIRMKSNSHVILFSVTQIFVVSLFLLFVRYLKHFNLISFIYICIILDTTLLLLKEAKIVLQMELIKSLARIHVRKSLKMSCLVLLVLFFSIPGCSCYDLHWIWVSDDLPQEV